jgi:hypothetical protein
MTASTLEYMSVVVMNSNILTRRQVSVRTGRLESCVVSGLACVDCTVLLSLPQTQGITSIEKKLMWSMEELLVSFL